MVESRRNRNVLSKRVDAREIPIMSLDRSRDGSIHNCMHTSEHLHTGCQMLSFELNSPVFVICPERKPELILDTRVSDILIIVKVCMPNFYSVYSKSPSGDYVSQGSTCLCEGFCINFSSMAITALPKCDFKWAIL